MYLLTCSERAHFHLVHKCLVTHKAHPPVPSGTLRRSAARALCLTNPLPSPETAPLAVWRHALLITTDRLQHARVLLISHLKLGSSGSWLCLYNMKGLEETLKLVLQGVQIYLHTLRNTQHMLFTSVGDCPTERAAALRPAVAYGYLRNVGMYLGKYPVVLFVRSTP